MFFTLGSFVFLSVLLVSHAQDIKYRFLLVAMRLTTRSLHSLNQSERIQLMNLFFAGIFYRDIGDEDTEMY